MAKRTTIELDEELLARAKRALGARTIRATVEDALRRAAEGSEDEQRDHAEKQRHYVQNLETLIDTGVLRSGEMWR